MQSWMWLAAGGILVFAELLTGDLVLVSLGATALAAGVVALLGADAIWQATAFALVAIVTLGVLRPIAVRNLRSRNKAVATNTDLLIGARGVTQVEVSTQSGRIKLKGEIWTARTRGDVIPANAAVRVLAIDGATAIVEATEE